MSPYGGNRTVLLPRLGRRETDQKNSVRYVLADGHVLLKMPVPRTKKHLSPTGTGKNAQLLNGLYVHSSAPRGKTVLGDSATFLMNRVGPSVLQVHLSNVRQWLRSGDILQLEQFVLDGQGHLLLREYSPDPKVRTFLKQIPGFLMKTKRLHEAAAKGDATQVQKLLSKVKSQDPPMRNIHLCKDQKGLGLLHKAVYYGYLDIVQFLILHYPECLKMKDNDGKTPLHYCGASTEAGKIWPLLVKEGADPNVLDSRGKTAGYYMERSNEIQLPEEKVFGGVLGTSNTDKNNNLVIKPSNIRIWIHDRDLGKLRQVVWEGQGAKLRVETSKHPKIKRFLEGIPYLLNVIKDVHSAVINDDFREFVKKTSDPVPIEILGSKDTNGLNPLHKAAGLNRREIAENILKRNQNLVFSTDQEGKTPLHYSAILKDDNAMYNLLIAYDADESAQDKNGKPASYYKTVPKEIAVKVLEVIPEAPRTSTFPQTFDWALFSSNDLPSTTTSVITKSSTATKVGPEESAFDESRMKLNESTEETKANGYEGESKTSDTEDKSSESDTHTAEQKEEQEKTFDIWTNDEEKREPNAEVEMVNSKEDSIKEKESESEDEKKAEEEEQAEVPVYNSYAGTESERREKTEREIAEERQRLLDEGLSGMGTEDEETEEGEKKVTELIEAGDMERLAFMVLNGEGHKLRGKTSSNPEIQSFLDNLPTYMAKITAVHNAAKNGSLKDLQSVLDRRRFAVAKESRDKLGATPLHVAVLYEKMPVVKYLGGRFPETLTTKDKFGRTPLHYAAILKDDHIYNTLVGLGADPNTNDDIGHTALYYQENQGELTREELMEEMNPQAQTISSDQNNAGVSSPVTDPSVYNAEPEISFDEGVPLSKSKGNDDGEDETNGNDALEMNFSPTDRDEYGQSVLHFAAARAHGRSGLFQLINESGVNLGFRDELYRTARDIAQQANIPENVSEIDKYVISLAAKGETTKLVELFLEGYDHILDLEDDEDNDIATVATKKNHEKTLAFLKAIPSLEEKRELVHRAIRSGNGKLVEDMVEESKNGRFLIIGKNSSGRCSLHIAVLCQDKYITEFISQKYPETLKIGDNLERTALHYAMGVDEVETLSKILIKCGAKRVTKDLKGRQPTYYFMNKTEILKLQEEENVLTM